MRGLHHLQLTPDSLVIAHDGTVKVVGTAVEAVLAGIEPDQVARGADRVDAVGLVRLLYAGLTARWPGDDDSPLGPAPQVTGRPVPPGDLVAGVPGDLDSLCAVALGPHPDGPTSPGELAQQLAPWAAAGPLTDPRGLTLTGPQRPAPDSVEALAAQAAAGHPPTATSEEEPPAPAATRSAASTTTWPTLPMRAVASQAASGHSVLTDADDSVATSTAGAVNGATAPARPVDTAGGDVDHGAARDTHSDLGDWALLAGAAPAPDGVTEPEAEPLGPFIPPAPVTRPTEDQTRLVLALVAGMVVVGLILAIFSLRGLFQSDDPLIRPEPLTSSPGATTTETDRAGAAAAPPPSPSGSSTVPPSTSLPRPPAEISGIQAIDPLGDGDENGSVADRAIDTDAATSWRSARYESASFGGLKQGLGLYLQLAPGPITAVTVEMDGRGGRVELRTTAGPGLDGSVVVATAQGGNGRVVLTPPRTLPGGPLLLWFTELPQQDSGEYRLAVTEIAVS
jgi:hypothetical protein